MTDLRAPFQYQGGKNRFAPLIVPYLLGAASPGGGFVDAFSGSGAVTWALINAGIEPGRITMIEGSIFGTLWAHLAAGTFDLDAFVREGRAIPDCKRTAPDYLRERISEVRDVSEALSLLPYVQAATHGGKQVEFDGQRGFRGSYYRFRTSNSVTTRPDGFAVFAPEPPQVTARVLAIADTFRRQGGPFVVNATVSPSGLRDALNGPGAGSVAYLDPPYEGTSGYSHGFNWRAFLSEPVRCLVFVSEYAEAGYSIRLAETTKGGIQGGKSRTERLNYFAPGSTV